MEPGSGPPPGRPYPISCMDHSAGRAVFAEVHGSRPTTGGRWRATRVCPVWEEETCGEDTLTARGSLLGLRNIAERAERSNGKFPLLQVIGHTYAVFEIRV